MIAGIVSILQLTKVSNTFLNISLLSAVNSDAD